MSATWKQAARNVQMVLLFTLMKHQGHKFKIANLVKGVSTSNLVNRSEVSSVRTRNLHRRNARIPGTKKFWSRA